MKYQLKKPIKYFLIFFLSVVVCYLLGMSGTTCNFDQPFDSHIAAVGFGAVGVLIIWAMGLIIWLFWNIVFYFLGIDI